MFPTVVLCRENDTNVAMGYLQPEQHIAYGKPVRQGYDVVQVTWVANQEGGVAALIVLGGQMKTDSFHLRNFLLCPEHTWPKLNS